MNDLVFGRDRVCRRCMGRGFVVAIAVDEVRPAFPSEIRAVKRYGMRRLLPCVCDGGIIR